MAAKKKHKHKLKRGTIVNAQPRGKVSVRQAPWDMGATGPANQARESAVTAGIDTEVDPDTGKVKNNNPNGVKRRVFHDMLDVYFQRGWITKRGHSAGADLRAAWERTEQGIGNDWSKERVDSTPKPDAAIAIQIDRVSKLVGITRRIPADDYRVLLAVVCEKHSIGRLPEYRGRKFEKGKAHLHEALERLADRLGY